MELGNFSMSLAVKNLEASKKFYETLGFEVIGGDASQNWLILKNDTTKIGLFQGMFDQNILTFNPGWNNEGKALTDFTDIRDIQDHLKANNISLIKAADSGAEPTSLMINDPDGNMILIDQHIKKPN